MNKQNIINITHRAALNYENKLNGNSFLYIYNNKFFELFFINNKFKHLTGIGSNLYAKDFYKKSLKNTIRSTEIYFNSNYPKDLCELKMQEIEKLYLITESDVLIFENFSTGTFTYTIALSNLNFTICLNKMKDSNGNIINNQYYVQSFRVGDEMNRSNNVFLADYIFKKNNQQEKYSNLLYGDITKINSLDKDIQNMIEFK